MIKLSKQQIFVATFLNIIIVLLVGCIVFLFLTGNIDLSPIGAKPVEHKLVRDARPSASGVFSWENNLGGTKEEELVAFLNLSGKLYVFGNTTSCDLDFNEALKAINHTSNEKKCGFLAILSENGKTENFVCFENEITKVIPLATKFAVGFNNSAAFSASVALVSLTGKVEKEKIIESTSKEEFIDIKFFFNKLHVVTSALDDSIDVKKLRVSIFSETLEPVSTILLSRTFTLKYLTIEPFKNSFVLAANVDSILSNYLTLAEYTEGGNVIYSNITLPENFITHDFTAFNGGFLALISHGDSSDIVQINSNLEKKSLIYLGISNCNNGIIAINDNSISVFAGFKDKAAFFGTFNFEFDNKELSNQFSSISRLFDFSLTPSSSFFIGKSTTSLSLVGKNNETSIAKDFGNGQEENALLLPKSNGVLVCSPTTKSKQFSNNFGDKDITICFITCEP